jgi:hypothetical protein
MEATVAHCKVLSQQVWGGGEEICRRLSLQRTRIKVGTFRIWRLFLLSYCVMCRVIRLQLLKLLGLSIGSLLYTDGRWWLCSFGLNTRGRWWGSTVHNIRPTSSHLPFNNSVCRQVIIVHGSYSMFSVLHYPPHIASFMNDRTNKIWWEYKLCRSSKCSFLQHSSVRVRDHVSHL